MSGREDSRSIYRSLGSGFKNVGPYDSMVWDLKFDSGIRLLQKVGDRIVTEDSHTVCFCVGVSDVYNA